MTAATNPRRMALVTGGTGALGREVVAELLAHGWAVTASYYDPGERDAAVERLGDPDALSLVRADLSTGDGAGDAVAAASGAGLPLAALVNVAGGFAMGKRMHEAEPAILDRMLEINLHTAWMVTRSAVPRLLAAGDASIVCVGAQAAREPFAGAAAYAVSKAAVVALVTALDAEYRAEGIRANAVLPSMIDTPANREASPDADFGRWVRPADIARVIRLLCEPDATGPTSGAAIPVYGLAG